MRRALLLAAAVLALGGCARGTAALAPAADPIRAPADLSGVPPEFRPACGHPGTTVKVTKVPVTVRHRDCDLTGTYVEYGLAGTGVPKPGLGASCVVDLAANAPRNEPTEVSVTVDKVTQDVTVTG